MFTLKQAYLLSTLFTSIDINSKENVVAVKNFNSTKLLTSFVDLKN